MRLDWLRTGAVSNRAYPDTDPRGPVLDTDFYVAEVGVVDHCRLHRMYLVCCAGEKGMEWIDELPGILQHSRWKQYGCLVDEVQSHFLLHALEMVWEASDLMLLMLDFCACLRVEILYSIVP